MSSIIYTFFYLFLILFFMMQYTFLLFVACTITYVLCAMHTVYCCFVVVLCCMLYLFVHYSVLCILDTMNNEEGGVVLCTVCEGWGRGGIEVGVRRRYPTSTLPSIFNSPGHSTLLTIHLPYGIIQLHHSPPFGLVYRAISQQGPASPLRGLILCPQNTIFFILP